MWLLVAIATMVVVLLVPTPDDLSVAGHRALAILAFAVIVWVTEAVSFPVSAFVIMGLIAMLIGLAPSLEADAGPDWIGTSAGLRQALSGFSGTAWALVLAALFLAAAMQVTNLHKRLALYVLKFVGQKTDAVLVGAILVSTILAFFVPSATARAGAVVPILLGMVAAFGLPAQSRLGALLVITAAQAVSIWNVGIKTAAAQNLVATGFIEEAFGENIAWGKWFIAAAPWSVVMSVVLFFVMRALIKPEINEIERGRDVINAQLAEMGPMKGREWRLVIVAAALLFFWSTEDVLHPIDSATITIVAIGLLLLPKVGVFTWNDTKGNVDWGTLVVFGVGISLGTVLLNSGGASWLSDATFGKLGLDAYPLVATIAIVGVFNILIHLGFASATSLASALIPVFIALSATLGLNSDQQIGFVLIQQFIICFGFLLPISAPQNMLAYGTGTFTTRDFFKSGVPLTVIGFLLILLMSATYWQWIGLI
jgi:anion transporter